MNKLALFFTLLTTFSLSFFTPAFADKDQPSTVNATTSEVEADKPGVASAKAAMSKTSKTENAVAEENSGNAATAADSAENNAAKDDSDKEKTAEGDEEPDCE